MKKVVLLFFCIVFMVVNAQTREWTLLHQGNRAFRNGFYKQAEDYYRRAVEAYPRSSRAAFNLGDAYLAQKNPKDALQQFERAAKTESNKIVKAMAFHNVGYVHHLNKEYDKAIEAYKESLRNNPRDNATRYNLILAQKQKKDEQKKQQNQQNKQNQQKDQNKQQNEQQNQQNSSQQQMSQDNVEQLLNLARQAEQETQQKMQKAKMPQPRQLDKNW